MTALSRLVDARAEKLGLSNRRISELSEQCPNGTISQGATGQYRRGRHPDVPSDRLLRVLSWTLRIPLRDLQRAAGVRESLEDWVPPPEAHQMDQRMRDAVEAIIKLLVAADQGVNSVSYVGTRDIAEDPPAIRELSAEERGSTQTNGAPQENGPTST